MPSDVIQEVLAEWARKLEAKMLAGNILRSPMRDCDDVPKYLKRMEKAHQQTAKSTLHFP